MSDIIQVKLSDYLTADTPSVALVAKGNAESDYSAYTLDGEGVLFVFENNLYVANVASIDRIISASGAAGAYLDGTAITGVTDDASLPNLIVKGNNCFINATVSGNSSASISNMNAALMGVDSVFSDNSGSNGGVLRINSGTTELSGLTFSENTTIAGSGGALYPNNGTLNGFNLLFVSNTADKYSGGAIHNNFSNTINLTDSIFKDNVAPANHAGAINNGDTAIVNLYGTTFSGNIAGKNKYGSAIYSTGTLTV